MRYWRYCRATVDVVVLAAGGGTRQARRRRREHGCCVGRCCRRVWRQLERRGRNVTFAIHGARPRPTSESPADALLSLPPCDGWCCRACGWRRHASSAPAPSRARLLRRPLLPPRMAAARAPRTGCNPRHPRRPAGRRQKRPRQRPHAEGSSCRALAPCAPRASRRRRKRRPSATPPRRGGTTETAPGAPARRRNRRRRERRATATAPERKRPRQRSHAESSSCRAPRTARAESEPPPRKRRPSVTPPRERRHD